MKKTLWLLPFCCFFAGYISMSRMFPLHERSVPSLLGLSLQDGLAALSAVSLYGSLMGEKEVSDVVPGAIVEQIPAAGIMIKERQAVSLVIAKRPPEARAPLVMGKQQAEIQQIVSKAGVLQSKEHWIEHGQPRGVCVAQYPVPGEELMGTLHIYYSKGITPVRVVPSFCGLPVGKGRLLLEEVGLSPVTLSLSGERIDAPWLLIQSQKPAPGALIVLRPGSTIHFFISE